MTRHPDQGMPNNYVPTRACRAAESRPGRVVRQCPRMMMYASLIGADMAEYFFAFSVLLRTESVCITDYLYILRLDVLIGTMLCFYSLFNQPS